MSRGSPRIGRARAEAPGHIASRKLGRGRSSGGGKPAFLADKATEVSVGMGAQLGAHSARTCSRRLSPARLGTVLTWARTHSCRSPPCRNIPGGQGVAGSNPAVPTGQSLISNAATGLRAAPGSAPRSHQFDETAVVRRVEGHNATGQHGPAEPTYGVAHPGALASGSKGHRFTSGRQGWLWATPAEDPGAVTASDGDCLTSALQRSWSAEGRGGFHVAVSWGFASPHVRVRVHLWGAGGRRGPMTRLSVTTGAWDAPGPFVAAPKSAV